VGLRGGLVDSEEQKTLAPADIRKLDRQYDPQLVAIPTTLTYLHTYSLTPWCRVLLEKLTGLQLGKKFPAFHGTRWFITALTSVRHLSLSWVSPMQSIYPHPTSWRSILILSTHLRLGLPSGLFPSGFPTNYTICNKLNYTYPLSYVPLVFNFLFCINVPLKYTRFLNLRPPIFGLTPCGCLHYTTLIPTYSIITYGNNFFIYVFFSFTLTLSGT